jgi:hypothetical protein
VDDGYITEANFQREIRHYATKEDLARLETKLIKWMVGLIISAIIATSAITTVAHRILS